MTRGKDLELTGLEIKYTRFIKQVINELNEMRERIEYMEQPKIEKKVIIKTVENTKIINEMNKEMDRIKTLLKKRDVEATRLKLKLQQQTDYYKLEKQGYLKEIQMLTESLNKLNNAIIE